MRSFWLYVLGHSPSFQPLRVEAVGVTEHCSFCRYPAIPKYSINWSLVAESRTSPGLSGSAFFQFLKEKSAKEITLISCWLIHKHSIFFLFRTINIHYLNSCIHGLFKQYLHFMNLGWVYAYSYPLHKVNKVLFKHSTCLFVLTLNFCSCSKITDIFGKSFLIEEN